MYLYLDISAFVSVAIQFSTPFDRFALVKMVGATRCLCNDDAAGSTSSEVKAKFADDLLLHTGNT